MGVMLRGLAGALAGALYGLLVGGLVYLLTYEDRHTPYPGPLIPDRHGMARLMTFLATAFGVACGRLVGLAVGLLGAGRWRAAAVGFGVGLAFQLVMSYYDNRWPALLKGDWPTWRGMLIQFAVIPCGLALTGAAVSAVAGIVGSRR